MHSVLEILAESTDSAGPDLVTLADLKLALGITESTDDATLQQQITFQSRMIAEYCYRRLGFAEALETFTFDPGEVLPVRQALTLSLYPVSAISEVCSAGATAMDYDFDPASGRLWTGGGWTAGKIAVVYSGGYDLPEQAPVRLQRAVIEAVNMGRQSGTRDPTISELQVGDTRVRYVTQQFASGT